MRRQRNIFPTKEKDKIPEKNSNAMEISNLPDKDFQSNGHEDAQQTWKNERI